MEANKIGIHDEKVGQKSWMRVAGSYLLLLAGFIIINSQIRGTQIDYTLIITLIGTAFGGKFAQKTVEK